MRESSRIHSVSTSQLDEPTPMYVTTEAATVLHRTIGAVPAETGGALGGTRRSSVIEHVHVDPTAAVTAVTYYPDIAAVNAMLRTDWNPRGINLVGFAHSHPIGATHPSSNDIAYSERILRAIPAMGRMLLPIIQSSADAGRSTILPWAVERRGPRFVLVRPELVVADPAPALDLESSPYFERVRDAYHLPTLANSRIVAVGCGGSAAWLIDMARTGVSEFVLIDPDSVEPSNVATQHVSIDDIGLPKVTALARRIIAVNPYAHVVTVDADAMLLDDEAFARLARAPFPNAGTRVPTTTLLCAFTDGFAAQARVARLGLQLDLPTISGTVYARGLGIEVAYAWSGATRACIRCALASRYRQVLDGTGAAAVPSSGAPHWATTRLNAAKTPIALALLHAKTAETAPEHPGAARWLRTLSAMRDRNLVITALDPAIGDELGMAQFDAHGHAEGGPLPIDLTLWRRPTPDGARFGVEPCPDCGGTEQLDERAGRFIDTRVMPTRFGEGDLSA